MNEIENKFNILSNIITKIKSWYGISKGIYPGNTKEKLFKYLKMIGMGKRHLVRKKRKNLVLKPETILFEHSTH